MSDVWIAQNSTAWSSVPNTPILNRKKNPSKHKSGGNNNHHQNKSLSQTGLHLVGGDSHDGVDKHNLLQSVKNKIPILSSSLRKGECGKIAIFGGCILYTGASYYCGVSALRAGADSVHVFCDAAAASVIRAYTTELVIHPVLDQEYGMEEVDAWLPRLDCVVVGPGLGRNQSMLGRISLVLQKIVTLNIPVIVDGDGLWHVVHQPNTLSGYNRAVITPNCAELGYLHKIFCGSGSSCLSQEETSSELATALGHITVVSKGPRDVITNGRVSLACLTPGSPKRCDGQGHILSGLMSAFLHWGLSSSYSPSSPSSSSMAPSRHQAIAHLDGTHNGLQMSDTDEVDTEVVVRAGWAACHLMRSSGLHAFNSHGRASSAQDIINSVGPQFQQIFDEGRMMSASGLQEGPGTRRLGLDCSSSRTSVFQEEWRSVMEAVAGLEDAGTGQQSLSRESLL